MAEIPSQNSEIPRICIVSSLYHTTLGGLGRQAVLLTERLAQYGIQLFVIARKMDKVPFCAYDPRVKVAWVRAFRPTVHILEEKSLPNLMTSLSFSFGALYLLWTRRKEYQIVHFHGASVPLMICILPLKFLKKRVIAKIAASNQGTEAGSFRGRYGLLGWVLNRLMMKVDLFIVTSKEIEEGLRKDAIPCDRLRRIPNFVDIKVFSQGSATLKIKTKADKGLFDHQVVTFSGRLVPGKGIAVLLDAWPSIRKEFPLATLVILGEGPQRRMYEQMAASRGLLGSVLFLGHVADVSDYLQATDVYVSPSFHEGFPNALLEAMACGLPVVASRIGGVEDVIKHEVNGLLVAPGNSDELAKAVLQFLQCPEKAEEMGRQAARTIREQYAIDAVAPRYLNLYRELSQSRSA